MAQRGVIQSRLRLDTKEFYTRLDAALKKAQQTAAAMQKAFGKPLTMPTIPSPTTGNGRSGSRGDPALAAQREAARQGAAAVRDLELAYRKGRISLDDLIAGAKRWEAQLERERSQLAENTKGYAAYTVSLRAVENILSRAARDGETRPVTAGINAISDALDRLQAAGALFLAGGFFSRFFGGLDRLARGNTQAKNALTLYRSELRDAGRDVDAEVARLDKLAARFKTNTEALSRFALILTRQGFTGEQQANLIEAVGASALNAGRDLNEAFGTAADAFARRDSALLNGLGIVTNFDDALQDFAKTQGVTADALDQASQNQAIYTGFIKETRQEVAALDVLLSGYAGSTASLENAQLSFGRTVGGVVTPVLTLLKDGLTLLLNLFNALPGPVKAVAVAAGVLATALAALAVAYVSLRVLLLNQTVLGPVVATLLKNETILRSRLGAAIIVQARAYGILDKEQVRSAVTARNSAAASAAAAGGVSRLSAAMGLLNKVGRFALIGIFIAIIREASKYLGVFRPIVDNVSQALAGMEFGKAVEGFNKIIAGGKLFATIFGQAVLYTVTAVALALEEIGFQATRAYLLLERLAAQATGNAARIAELNQALVDNRQAHEDSKNAILDNAAAYDQQLVSSYLAASGIETVGAKAETTAAALRELTDVQRGTFAEISKGLGDFKLDLNAGDLTRELASATAPLDDYLAQIEILGKEIGQNNPLVIGLRESARQLRREATNNVLADAVKTAQESATQAQIGAMQEGSAKIEAQRQADIAAERSALEEQLQGFKGHADTRTALIEASNARIAAINASANQALQQDAEQRLETQRNLNERLAQMQQQLASEQANLSNDPLAAIQQGFEQTSNQIVSDVASLADEVQRAYVDGTISKEDYLAELLEIGRIGNARLQAAEEQATKDTQAEIKKRRDAVLELSEGQARALAEAQIAGMEEGAAKQTAQFEQERQERLRQYRQQLVDFQGTLSERRKLLVQQNATEVQLAQNNVAAAKANLQAALANLRQAQKEYAEQVKQANEEALRQTLANQKAINDARITAAQEQYDGADNLREQQAAYERLLGVQRQAVVLAGQFTQFERERGANAEEITNALNGEAQAQRGVVGVIQQQIDKLKELRDEQLQTIQSGTSVIDLFRESQKITGREADQGAIENALQAQLDAQARLYQQQVESGAELDAQLQTLKDINATREQAAKEGVNVSLSQEAVQVIDENSLNKLSEAPGQIQQAADKFFDLDQQIRGLGDTLEKATGRLIELLEQAGSGEGLEIKVVPVYDDSAVKAAQAAVSNAFEALRAAQEEASKVQREESQRTTGELGRARQQLAKTQGDLARTGQQITDTARQAGARAGGGLMSAFASGITRNRGALLSAVDRVLADVRARLPSSDARTGPLSDLTYSGGKLVTTFSGGMERKFSHLAGVSERMAAIARPAISAVAIPTSRPASFPVGAGAAGQTINHNTVQIDGRTQPMTGIFGMTFHQFMNEAEREMKVRGG